MTEALGDDRAKRARRNVERALGSIKPTTSTRKVLVTIAVPVAGVLTEQAVRALEQKGPELHPGGSNSPRKNFQSPPRSQRRR